MKLLILYVMTASWLLSLPSIAQNREIKIPQQTFKRLRIGDIVPMESIKFENVLNYPGGKAKLSDFKGKYIILDFWSKYCGFCIQSFPKMNELQAQFKNDIQILLITHNSTEELASLLKNSPTIKNNELPMIIGEQVLTKLLFPHQTEPYHVWLDKEGKVVMTTSHDGTNTHNLKNLIDGKALNMVVRNDILDDNFYEDLKNPKISLLDIYDGYLKKAIKFYAPIPQERATNMLPIGLNSVPNSLNYSIFTSCGPKGSNLGIPDPSEENSILTDKNGSKIGLRFYNWTIKNLWNYIYWENQNQPLKIIMEDSKARKYFDEMPKTNLTNWEINNTYCYESSMLNYDPKIAKEILQHDLSRFIGLKGKVEDRLVKHVVLTRLGTSNEKDLWMKNQKVNEYNYTWSQNTGNLGVTIRNLRFTALVTELILRNNETTDPIIIDETKFSTSTNLNAEKKHRKINIVLNGNLKCSEENIPLIRKELAKYGIGLKEEMRKIKVLVLSAFI